MTNQEVLEKAIEKAVAGGYNGKLPVASDSPSHEWHPYGLIFNHDFAKALWGEYKVSDKCKCGMMSIKPHAVNSNGKVTLHGPEVINLGWKHQLQQMVIAEDPVKYLGEHT